MLEFSKHEEILTIYETMMANFLAPSITIPTRISNNGGALIDSTFTHFSNEKFLSKMSNIIDRHMPVKKFKC